MTSEFLLDAIGQMDDELVLAAAQTPKVRPIPWKKVAGLAAALMLCVGVAGIPGLLSRNGMASGTAAPEGNMSLVADMADGALGDYEYRTEQESVTQEPSAAMGTDSKTSAETQGGLVEPVFFTGRGIYMLTEAAKWKLPPESAISLGELAAAVPGQSVYPATRTQELVGCPVWESEDGQFLYVQLPDSQWLTAKLHQ